MGEGFIQQFVRGAQTILFGWLALGGLIITVLFFVFEELLKFDTAYTLIIVAGLAVAGAGLFSRIIGTVITKPTTYLAQAILHLSPTEHLVAAPNVDDLRYGKQLVENLTRQVYDFGAHATASDSENTSSLPSGLLDQLPVAVIGLNEANQITIANTKAVNSSLLESLVGRQFSESLTFIVDNDDSIDSWLKSIRESSLTGLRSWQKVEVHNLNGEQLGYFDIAVSFNKHSATGVEAILTLTDHSDAYEQEDASLSFIALAVHELRNPITILRGYVEAFHDELGSDANPQLQDDLKKMNAAAENLSTFIRNILNVARINQGQLTLNLQEDNWNTELPKIVDSLRNRAAANGKSIELRMEPDLPSVAIDPMTIGEVITNLVDNAIKYSPDSAPNIQIVSRANSDGKIETTVTDQGVGIPGSVMPHLFNKFRRNHRNQGQVTGTGLGLFLCKSIVTAHYGNIWASSKENEGSTFGFTLLPYSQLAQNEQSGNNTAIVRSKHGWIKNHSMQRR